MIKDDRNIVDLTYSRRTTAEIARELHYSTGAVGRVRWHLHNAQVVAMAELACLHPTEYNDLIERYMTASRTCSAGVGGSPGKAVKPAPALPN